jgi:hypothetical protein
MSRIKFLCVVCVMLTWALGAWAPGARGGFAKAYLAQGHDMVAEKQGGNNTFSVSAYSEEFGVTNASVTSTVIVNGNNLGSLPANRRGYTVDTKGRSISVPTGEFGMLDGKKYEKVKGLGPTARLVSNSGSPNFLKSWLKIADDEAEITSKTGNYVGDGAAFINAMGERLLYAAASYDGQHPPNPGSAAGQAGDPFFIPSGSPLIYDPILNDSIQLDAGESGGAISWASDSSVFTSDNMDNFVQDGAPLDQTLWYLTLGGQGPIASTSDVGIDFELNPLALNEIAFPSSFLAGLGSYSDATSEAALIDQAIDQTVAAALTLNGNEVDLSGFDPFPTGTTFSAISGGVEYADGVDAGISGDGFSSTPAPQAWLLFATGFLGLFGAGWRRSKLSSA